MGRGEVAEMWLCVCLVYFLPLLFSGQDKRELRNEAAARINRGSSLSVSVCLYLCNNLLVLECMSFVLYMHATSSILLSHTTCFYVLAAAAYWQCFSLMSMYKQSFPPATH